MDKNWLLTLNEIDIDDLTLVGGKAYNLGTLSRNGLTVPQGLVVTSPFFEAQIQHYKYTPIWAGSPDVAVTEGALQFLADVLKSKPVAPHLNKALQTRLSELFPSNIQTFAVRSSAIDEDSADYSFAGCHLTELGVPRPMLTISLTRCWASALAGSAIEYRLKHSMSLQAIKIAVVIQPLLQPETAGVAFTINPISGARDEFIIEAAAGLGESVVGGRIKPYRYHLARQAPTYPLQQKIVGDTTNLTREPLSSKQLTNLGQTLDQVEALMGGPQDVEWAYQDNNLYLLQTRPVTVTNVASPDLIEIEPDFNAEWTRGNYSEALPEIPSQLFASLMERTQDKGIKFFTDVGLDVTGIGPYIKIIYGRPYLNLTMLKRILSQLGFSPGSLLTMAGYAKSSDISNPFKIDWPTLWQARGNYFNLIVEILQIEQTVDSYHHTIAQVITQLAEPSTNAAQTLAQFKLRERVYGDLIIVGLILLATLTGFMALIAKLIGPIFDSSTKIFTLLGTLGKNPAAVHHNVTLLNLSRRVHEEAQVLSYLTKSKNDYSNYETVLAGTQFLANFQTYLDEYGYQATYEADMGWPRFKDQPEVLLRTISHYVKLIDKGQGHLLPSGGKQSFWQVWFRFVREAKGIYRWVPWRQVVALPFMGMLNQTFAFRNAILIDQIRAMAAVREWDLAMGQKWVEAGFLETPEDIFWLKMAEIEQTLVAKGDTSFHLKSTIISRKAAYQNYAEINVPFVVKDADIPSITFKEANLDEILGSTITGLPVSPGQVQGTVRFLQDFDSLDQVPKECVLVTPTADPAYFPFFPLASGLIVEIGGVLSHGSIIAREYGLPAVSNVPNARNLLNSGDRVLLDGSTGVVQILERVE